MRLEQARTLVRSMDTALQEVQGNAYKDPEIHESGPFLDGLTAFTFSRGTKRDLTVVLDSRGREVRRYMEYR